MLGLLAAIVKFRNPVCHLTVRFPIMTVNHDCAGTVAFMIPTAFRQLPALFVMIEVSMVPNLVFVRALQGQGFQRCRRAGAEDGARSTANTIQFLTSSESYSSSSSESYSCRSSFLSTIAVSETRATLSAIRATATCRLSARGED